MNFFDNPWYQQIGPVVFGAIMGWLAKVFHIRNDK